VLIYLHGFNSSPQSHKAQRLKAWLAEQGLEQHYACPALPPRPREAIAMIEALLPRDSEVCFVGSSLGGFYATCLAEKHGARAVLINPAIDPHVGLRAYLGEQQNLYTGERYILTEADLEQWRKLYAPRVTASRYLLLVETGDEVLDYRLAMVRYAGAQQRIVEGGDHTFQSFPSHLALIARFGGLARP
jgi:predicted esterase YcpF (UPF0227 family)